MGLDTTHECWHGAYSAFSRWRNKLAEVAGYRLTDIKDEPSGMIFNTPLIDWGHVQDKNYQGEWDKTPDDPLIVIITHSDCDGVIHPTQAKPLIKRLEELLPLLPDDDGGGHIGNWRVKTQQFIDGLKESVSKNEDVEFG